MAESDRGQFEEWKNKYFELSLHQSLHDFLRNASMIYSFFVFVEYAEFLYRV